MENLNNIISIIENIHQICIILNKQLYIIVQVLQFNKKGYKKLNYRLQKEWFVFILLWNYLEAPHPAAVYGPWFTRRREGARGADISLIQEDALKYLSRRLRESSWSLLWLLLFGAGIWKRCIDVIDYV